MINLFPVFRPEREYVYSYEGQVAAGLPIASQKYSGLKIKAQVRIQVKANSQAIVQVSQVTKNYLALLIMFL